MKRKGEEYTHCTQAYTGKATQEALPLGRTGWLSVFAEFSLYMDMEPFEF